MNANKIVIRGQEFGDIRILDGNCLVSDSLPCDALAIDDMSVTMDGSVERGTRFKPKGASGLRTADSKLFYVRPLIRVLVTDFTQFPCGEPVWYYHADKLVSKFYIERKRRIGTHHYEITCTSAMGLAENSRHYGGIYNATPLQTVLAEVVGGVFPYTLDARYAGLAIYGWLPIATRRENLQQLLFATGLSARKNADGDPYITALTANDRKTIVDDRMLVKGDVDYDTPITRADVSEHAYIASAADEEKTLYEGEVPAENIETPKGAQVLGTRVEFSEPIHSLAIADGTLLEHGVNYAVIGQSSACKLTGKPYTHTTRIVTATDTAAQGLLSVSDNIMPVTDATLVSLANSENVARRVFAYYGKSYTVTNDIISGVERPGDAVRFRDPFDAVQVDGFVRSMDITLGGVLQASTSLTAGYTPTGVGNFYTRSDLMTMAGGWRVPAGVYKIRAVLGSAGDGGASGNKGVRGEGSTFMEEGGNGGAGGAGGSGGAGGNIYVVTMNVTPGQVIQFTPGKGGTGGASTGGDSQQGAAGGHTIFGSHSSAAGKPSEKGYADIFGKGVFSLSGNAGLAGGKGSGKDGVGEPITLDGGTYTVGANGLSVSDNRGTASGGGGGGAGYGANGAPGTAGSTYRQPDNTTTAQGGRGGVGGNSSIAGKNAATYGSGGSGGHGGGGGGAGGAARASVSYGGDGADGGVGSAGGRGGNGYGLIYY